MFLGDSTLRNIFYCVARGVLNTTDTGVRPLSSTLFKILMLFIVIVIVSPPASKIQNGKQNKDKLFMFGLSDASPLPEGTTARLEEKKQRYNVST